MGQAVTQQVSPDLSLWNILVALPASSQVLPASRASRAGRKGRQRSERTSSVDTVSQVVFLTLNFYPEEHLAYI